MSEKCGVRLTVHGMEDGHERPSGLGLLIVRTIGLCASAFISCYTVLMSLLSGGMLLSEGLLSAILGVVVMLTGMIIIPVALFRGVMVVTRQ